VQVAPPELPEPTAAARVHRAPAMYQCISYDGIGVERELRPEPALRAAGHLLPVPEQPHAGAGAELPLGRGQLRALSDASACERWRQKRKDAASESLRSFSDTAHTGSPSSRAPRRSSTSPVPDGRLS
jgi:hypothetical protein